MLFLQFSATVDLTLYGTSHTDETVGTVETRMVVLLLPLDFLYREFTLALIGVVTCIVERVLSAENNYIT